MKKKNVLMIGLYPPHIGGVASYVHELTRALESLGVTVYIVTYGKASEPHVYGTFTTRRLRGLSFLATGTRKAYQIIKKKDIDILHAHYLVPPGLVGVSAKNLSHIPLVVTCHGSDILVFSTGWKRIISQYVAEHADYVVCNSKATLTTAKELSSTDTRFIPSGVNLDQFYPLSVKREAVTYVGGLSHVKGVDIFLRAMRGIPEKVWIIGDGPERSNLERLAEELQVDCTFWGFRTDICEFMNKSKIVVLPSRKEGFGLTILEAMACGTPVIGKNTGGIPEIITGENGLLFNTEEELHEKVLNLLQDNILWKQLREKGLETVSQWSWEETALLYADLYDKL
ncbi:MAG: glycosyltransferase family 4 protein [Theionarchaea archaeon]|nr:glycosyltransferase family 4 protein [Theionarchaea archaeon]